MNKVARQIAARFEAMTPEEWAEFHRTGIPPRPLTPQPTPTQNPIVDAVCESLWRNQLINLRLPRDEYSEAGLAEAFHDLPGLKAKLGSLLLDAMTSSNKGFAKAVGAAISKADRIFGRNHDRVLLESVLTWRANDPRFANDYRGPLPTVGEYRRDIEERFNRSKKLDEHRWKKLRQALYPWPLKAERAGRKSRKDNRGKPRGLFVVPN